MASKTRETSILFTTRQSCIGLLRVAFGVTWVVASWLKWQPAFIHRFADTLKGAMDGQPHAVQMWIGFWLTIVNINPTLFAVLEATTETLLAICFLLGLFTNVACIVSILLSLGIWTIAEGFGGPYIAGQSTDIGTALPYALFSALLLCARAGNYYSLDHLLASRLKGLSFLASGSEKTTAAEEEQKDRAPQFVGERRISHRR